MTESPVVELARTLISYPSLSPDQSSLLEYLHTRLTEIGLECTFLMHEGRRSLWAMQKGDAPLVVFSGHSDVVPPGEISAWRCDPYRGDLRDGVLYGRGAADMKGAIAAMIVAVERVLSIYKANTSRARIGFLITGDEEIGGASAAKITEELFKQGTPITLVMVGEPTSSERVGDTIKIGRRGSLNFQILFRGVQGHVGYPQEASNALHTAFLPLHEIATIPWNDADEHFEATSLQITQMNGGRAYNIIPGEVEIKGNVRFPISTSAEAIIAKMEGVLKKAVGERFEWSYEVQALPFITSPYITNLCDSLHTVASCVQKVTGIAPGYSTSGGTSDARHFARYHFPVVELGLLSRTIHKVNECVSVRDLELLEEIYVEVLRSYITQPDPSLRSPL